MSELTTTTTSRRLVRGLAIQVPLFLAAVLAYFRIRGLTESRPGIAYHNASLLVGVERDLGIDWEYFLQQKVIGSPMTTRVLNWIYIFGHWPVIALTLVWLLARHPEVFRRTRNAIFTSGTVGMIVFATFPVAPPRLDALGLVDTVAQQSRAYRILQPAAFTNQFAAMPSLHVGWGLLIGLAIWTAARRIWLRLLGLAMPVAMFAAVLLTANHYLLDAVAGAGLTTLTWLLWKPSRRRREGTDSYSRTSSIVMPAASVEWTCDARCAAGPDRPADRLCVRGGLGNSGSDGRGAHAAPAASVLALAGAARPAALDDRQPVRRRYRPRDVRGLRRHRTVGPDGPGGRRSGSRRGARRADHPPGPTPVDTPASVATARPVAARPGAVGLLPGLNHRLAGRHPAGHRLSPVTDRGTGRLRGQSARRGAPRAQRGQSPRRRWRPR